MQREDEAWHKGEAGREWRANPEIMDFKVLRIIAELLEEQRHPLLLLLNFERDDAMWLMLEGRRSALLIRSGRGLRGSNDYWRARGQFQGLRREWSRVLQYFITQL
jgi:hypothetical protein